MLNVRQKKKREKKKEKGEKKPESHEEQLRDFDKEGAANQEEDEQQSFKTNHKGKVCGRKSYVQWSFIASFLCFKRSRVRYLDKKVLFLPRKTC